MENWTPEAIRTWIFETLYPLYMKKPRGYIIFSNKPSDEPKQEPEPDINETIREIELLEQLGYVEIVGTAWDSIYARLTPSGRLYWEQLQQPPSEPEEPRPLGFDV